jgi:TldD protein
MEFERLLSRYEYAELRIEKGTESRVGIKDDEVRHSSGSYYGASVRVLEGGSWGFASSSSGEDIEAMLEKAKRLAVLNKGGIELALPPCVKREVRDKAERLDEESRVEALCGISKAMKADKVTSRSISCSEALISKEFYNSGGSEIMQEHSYTYLSCSCIAKEGTAMQRGNGRASSRTGFAGLKLQEAADEARDKALRLLEAAPPPKGRFTVVLDHEMTGVFAHEALGHACEADSILERESVLSDRMGRQIGNQLVTVIDDPSAGDFGRYAYDDEGVAAKAVTLIEKGVLKGYMNSMETTQALKMGGSEALNGHARAEGYSEAPVVRMSNTYFQKGGSKLDEVFDARSGIYLRGMRGGSVDIFTGGFMFKSEEAYEIKDGEKAGPIRDVTITGNVLQTMLDVECVGDDFGTSPGFCGKFSQDVPVSDGGPHIRVKNVAIG